MTILLVDDDDGINTIWTRHLRSKFDAEFRYAKTVEEAVEQMRKIPPPDLVLLDMNLPPRTAIETASEIHRLREFNPHLAVIAISGMQKEELDRAVAGVVVEAVALKQDIMLEADLIRLVKNVLESKKKTTSDLLTIIRNCP